MYYTSLMTNFQQKLSVSHSYTAKCQIANLRNHLWLLKLHIYISVNVYFHDDLIIVFTLEDLLVASNVSFSRRQQVFNVLPGRIFGFCAGPCMPIFVCSCERVIQNDRIDERSRISFCCPKRRCNNQPSSLVELVSED